VAKAD